MEYSPKYSWSLQRTPDGPLAPYIDGFKERLCALGYAETSAHLYTRLAADFSGWLKQKNVAQEEITPEHTLRYLRYRARNRRPRRCGHVNTSVGPADRKGGHCAAENTDRRPGRILPAG